MEPLRERIKRLLTFATGLFECICFAGVLFGWASLVFVLKKEKYFADLCDPVQNISHHGVENGTMHCDPQDERFTLLFTLGAFMNNFVTLPCGFMFDRFGTMATRFFGIFLYTTATLMIAFSHADTAVLLFPAICLLAVGGILFLLTNIQVGNLFGRRRSTVITLYNGAFDSSSVVFLVVKVIYEAGISLRNVFLFISCLSSIHIARTYVLLPRSHIPYPLPDGYTYGLGSNKVGDLGVKLLAEILRNPDCKIQQLCLNSNMLTDSCADDLSSILSTGRSLTVVNLNDNKLGDSGVKLLPAALRNPNCKIQKLELRDNCLSESCAEDFASILNTNQSLAELNLGNNKLKHLGVKRLSLALMNPHCKIQKLLLYRNGLTKSCVQVLSSALSKNQSLMKLNVNNNNLGDSGMKLLCAVLGNSDCKLQKLHLYDVGLTDSCAQELSTAFNTNQSLKVLDLGSNSFSDQFIPTVTSLLQTCRGLELIGLWGNSFSPNGKRCLKSLQESRAGLTVSLGDSFNL